MIIILNKIFFLFEKLKMILTLHAPQGKNFITLTFRAELHYIVITRNIKQMVKYLSMLKSDRVSHKS